MQMTDIDITGIDKAVLLAALFNHSKQLGAGKLDESGQYPLTVDEARNIIQARTHAHGWRSSFDYLRGRVINCDIGGDLLDACDAWVYDRDNGAGRCVQAIEFARKQSAK
jgi:hypothetical protein